MNPGNRLRPMGALLGGLLAACGTAPADTGTCAGTTCTSELLVTFSDGRTEFSVSLTGLGFNTLFLDCPEGVAAGGMGQATCEGAGFAVRGSGFTFPDQLTLSVDGGDPIELAPDWSWESACGVSCNSAAVEVTP